jgi:DNA-binding NtrC family response regulator
MQAMMKYDWPGNVRELENLIERALILTDNGEEISASSLFPTLGFNATQTLSADGHLVDVDDEAAHSESNDWIESALNACESLEEIEQKFLDYALDKANGNVSEAARVLGVSRPTLAYRMKKMEEK